MKKLLSILTAITEIILYTAFFAIGIPLVFLIIGLLWCIDFLMEFAQKIYKRFR